MRTPIAVLLGNEETPPTPDVAAMLVRGTNQDLPDDARRGLQEFAEFLDVYGELADATDFTVRGMHESPFVSVAGFESGEDARRKAEEVRAHLRVGLGPIGDMDTGDASVSSRVAESSARGGRNDASSAVARFPYGVFYAVEQNV